MKKAFLYISIILASVSVTVILMHDHFTGRFPWQPLVSAAKVLTIHSKILKEDREVIVHLPIDYDSSKQYPVMYVLDGSSLDEPVVNSFSVLSLAGFSSAVIVVGIPNVSEESRQRDYTPSYLRQDIDDEKSPDGEADKFLTFMEAELIQFIESKYSTSDYRLFAGHSRGPLNGLYRSAREKVPGMGGKCPETNRLLLEDVFFAVNTYSSGPQKHQ